MTEVPELQKMLKTANKNNATKKLICCYIIPTVNWQRCRDCNHCNGHGLWVIQAASKAIVTNIRVVNCHAHKSTYRIENCEVAPASECAWV